MSDKNLLWQEGMQRFLVEAMMLTDEQNAAIDHRIPMTQAIFDDILDKCEEVGEFADPLFFYMLEEYKEFMVFRANKIWVELKDG